MAYNANTLFPTATRPRREGIQSFTYRTGDTLAVVAAAGYFDTSPITDSGGLIEVFSTASSGGGYQKYVARRKNSGTNNGQVTVTSTITTAIVLPSLT